MSAIESRRTRFCFTDSEKADLMVLPLITSEEELIRLDRANCIFSNAAKRIADKHCMNKETVTLFPAGSVFVFGIGQKHVLKLFPPYCRHERDNEVAFLKTVQTGLPDFVPKVCHQGQFDLWSYFIMTRLPGVPLDTAWKTLTPKQQFSIIKQIADIVKTLHHINVDDITVPKPDWTQFIKTQRENCLTRQQKLGLDEKWLAEIEHFLGEVIFPDYTERRTVLLHTEIMRQHIMIVINNSEVTVSGLIDFEPGMIGDFEYELASVLLFVSGTDPKLFNIFLDHYNPELLLDDGLSKRILAYILLHRYSNFPWFLSLMPPVKNFNGCLQEWFP